VDGKKVVDLCGSAKNAARANEYNHDSLAITYSSIKSVTALATALMVDRGLINYDDLVWSHWPEFGKEGKALTRVEDIMRHECGLVNINESFAPEDYSIEGFKSNKLGKALEIQRQDFLADVGTIRSYHSFTRGILQSELIRRVDPKGRTAAEVILEDIAAPLDIDIFIGVPKEKEHRYFRHTFLTLKDLEKNSSGLDAPKNEIDDFIQTLKASPTPEFLSKTHPNIKGVSNE